MSDAKPSASLSGMLLARKGGARPAMRRPNAIEADGAIEPGQDDLGCNDMGYDVNPTPETPMDHKHARINPLAAAVPEATPEVKKQQDRIAAQLQAHTMSDYPQEAIGVLDNANSLSIGGTWAPGDDEDLNAEAEEVAEEKIEAAAEEKVECEQEAESDAFAASDETAVVEEVQEEKEPVPAEMPVLAEPELDVAAQLAAIQQTESVSPPKKRAARGSKAKAAFTLRIDKERHLKLRLATAVSNKSAQKLVIEALDRMLEDMPEIKALAANVPTKN